MRHVNDLAMALLVVTLAGLWMLRAGLEKRGLEWRRPKRRCPSCHQLPCRCT
jgi:hypothetical protein